MTPNNCMIFLRISVTGDVRKSKEENIMNNRNNEYYFESSEFSKGVFDFIEFTPEQETKFFNSAEFIFSKESRRLLDDYKTKINNNVVVMGTSGSGKTTSFIEPNIRQAVGNYVISDPKGALVRRHGRALEDEGYNVFVVDFQNPETSVRYNPLSMIETTQDIMRIANMLTYGKDGKGNGSSLDPFWDQNTVTFISALIGYMVETDYRPKNFKGLMDLLSEGERFTRRTVIDGERRSTDKASKLADRFEELHRENPHSWAYSQFVNVNAAPEKTYDCFRVCLSAKFANYTTEELEYMMSGNDIDLDSLVDHKFAIFVIQSDSDRSMDGLVNLYFSQTINRLCSIADRRSSSRLPIPVRFFLDDYGATTVIDNLDSIISTIRSRAISVSLILQSESQLSKGKQDSGKTILANCDTYIYMGGNDVNTAKSVSVRCNKPLEQVLYMPVGNCWVFERGKKPVMSEIADRVEFENNIAI